MHKQVAYSSKQKESCRPKPQQLRRSSLGLHECFSFPLCSLQGVSKVREFILPPDLSLPPSACGDPFEELLFHCRHPLGEPKERAHWTKALLLSFAHLTLPWQRHIFQIRKSDRWLVMFLYYNINPVAHFGISIVLTARYSSESSDANDSSTFACCTNCLMDQWKKKLYFAIFPGR